MGRRSNHRLRDLKGKRKKRKRDNQFILNSRLRTMKKRRGLYLLHLITIKIWVRVSMSPLPHPREDRLFNLTRARVQTVPPNLFTILLLSNRMIQLINLKKSPIILQVARKRRRRKRRSAGTAFYKNQSCTNWWNPMVHCSLSLKRALPWKKKRVAVGVTSSSIRALGALTLEIIWLTCRCYRIIRLSRRRRNR